MNTHNSEELREEMNRERYEREQNAKWAANHHKHPNDPDKVSEDEEDETNAE